MIKISAAEIGVLVTSQAKLGPVCEELARLDLLAFVTEGDRRVTLRQLAQRWGWRKDRVRRSLGRVDEVEMISGRGSAGSILRAKRHRRDKDPTRT